MENPNDILNGRCNSSQLRYDEVSQDWVVISPGRGKRPEAFKRERIHSDMLPQNCVFCNLETGSKPLMAWAGGEKIMDGTLPSGWTLAVIPNKFPAFCPPVSSRIKKIHVGPVYHLTDAAGFCEVVITRDHNKSIALLEVAEVKEIIDAYHSRYIALKGNRFVKYISIFHNHGVEAGASQPHPHSQIITTPLIDVDLRGALRNSQKYYRRTKKCLGCEMIAWELEAGVRLVCENDDFLALCPFASKVAFDVVITPKKHSPYFEQITEDEKNSLADIMSRVMKKIYKGLNDPPYNFYLHTAPADGKDYNYYHWHFTIRPKTATMAGFEMGAHMEISTIVPEAAAEYLRQQ